MFGNRLYSRSIYWHFGRILSTTGLGNYHNMSVSITQLVVGFQSAMNIPTLADHLGVTAVEVRDRLRSLTSAEEAQIMKSLEGD